MAIRHITTMEEFETEVKQSEDLVIIDFWAPWCGPCKMIGPIFEKISDHFENVKFIKVDVDEAQDIATQFNIMSIPTLIILKGGEVLDQQMGALSEEQLKDFINSQL